MGSLLLAVSMVFVSCKSDDPEPTPDPTVIPEATINDFFTVEGANLIQAIMPTATSENPIEHTCDIVEGQQWISVNGECPDGMCTSAWSSMRDFVESLAMGEGNFYNGWMKNPMSAMISCNDGFRPFSFYIEVIE